MEEKVQEIYWLFEPQSGFYKKYNSCIESYHYNGRHLFDLLSRMIHIIPKNILVENEDHIMYFMNKVYYTAPEQHQQFWFNAVEMLTKITENYPQNANWIIDMQTMFRGIGNNITS